MANPEHVKILSQGVDAWNQWRQSEGSGVVPDLSGARLAGNEFAGINLAATNLEGTNLRESNLTNARLDGALFANAIMAGANLTGATLPEPLTKLFDELKAVGDISESARKLFIAMLAACLYSWLTIATTTDANLITDRASSPLPIIQTSIPIVGFYVVAPLLLLCVYLYFHWMCCNFGKG